MSDKKVSFKTRIKKAMPTFLLRSLYKTGLYKTYKPSPGKVSFGDLHRKMPFSYEFGYDRGGPVDRYYIENFLSKHASSIKGRVLEIGDNEYTMLFGKERVLKSDILHVDATNEQATFVGDLTDAPQIPSGEFDCIVLTQTLHLVYDFEAALRTCHRILKPGGTLLLTVPGISHIDYNDWGEHWMYAFTKKAMQTAIARTFGESESEWETFGNVFIATSFLYGVGLPEVTTEYLNHNDPNYQVIVAGKITKK